MTKMSSNLDQYLSEVSDGTDGHNNTNKYYLLSVFRDTSYELTLISANRTVDAVIDYEDYRRLNADNESSNELDDRLKQVAEALRVGSRPISADASGANYRYRFSVDDDSHCVHISVQLFDGHELIADRPLIAALITRQRSTSEGQTVTQVLDRLVPLMESKDQLIGELRHQNRQLREVSDRSISDLNEFTTKKEESEAFLFTKFVSIVNQKKLRIKELEDLSVKNN